MHLKSMIINQRLVTHNICIAPKRWVSKDWPHLDIYSITKQWILSPEERNAGSEDAFDLSMTTETAMEGTKEGEKEKAKRRTTNDKQLQEQYLNGKILNKMKIDVNTLSMVTPLTRHGHCACTNVIKS